MHSVRIILMANANCAHGGVYMMNANLMACLEKLMRIIELILSCLLITGSLELVPARAGEQ